MLYTILDSFANSFQTVWTLNNDDTLITLNGDIPDIGTKTLKIDYVYVCVFSSLCLSSVYPHVLGHLQCSIYWNGQTVGQQVLGIRYALHSSSSFSNNQLTASHKVLFAVVTIGSPWLRDRLEQILVLTGMMGLADKAGICVLCADGLYWIEP